VIHFDPKRKATPKVNYVFHEIENPHHHVRNFVSAMTLKWIVKDIFHLIFYYAFGKDVMRWYNKGGKLDRFV